jgi:hypothetical protein
VCVCVFYAMTLCYKLPEMSQPPTPQPLLRKDFSRTPFVSNSSLRVARFRRPVVTAKPRVQSLDLMTIFRNAWGFDNAL